MREKQRDDIILAAVRACRHVCTWKWKKPFLHCFAYTSVLILVIIAILLKHYSFMWGLLYGKLRYATIPTARCQKTFWFNFQCIAKWCKLSAYRVEMWKIRRLLLNLEKSKVGHLKIVYWISVVTFQRKYWTEKHRALSQPFVWSMTLL